MNARQAALHALVEWDKGKAFSDEILHTLFARQPRLRAGDRAFVRETFFGVLRNLSALDFLIARLRPAGSLEARPRHILRLGLYQLFHLRVAVHAAVHETVELGGPARGLVNAVLRRALREKPALEQALAAVPLATREVAPGVCLPAGAGSSATRIWRNSALGTTARRKSTPAPMA